MTRYDTEGIATALAALVLLTGCVGAQGHRWPWDHDRPVTPLRERAAPAAAEPSFARSYVVLLPDDDGSVGRVNLDAGAGVTTLSEAGQAADLGSPRKAFDLTDEQVRQTFAGAFGGEPKAPASYVLYFRTDSTDLVSRSRQEWPGIAAAIVARPAPEVVVDGHADRAGSDSYNEGLSRRRAHLVRELLIQAGVPLDWVETRWHGEKRPAVPTADGVQEQGNRRVELRVR